MKISKLLFPVALLALGACGGGNGKDPEIKPDYTKVESETLYAKKVIDEDSDFIMGMDVSSVLAEEASGVKYYNFKGEEADLFEVLSENGVNYIRVRVWNNPYDDKGHGFGGGNNDINAAVEIGKRATKYNMKLLVDFHYSDFWADPGKQKAPRAWAGMLNDEKAEALYQYTKESLQLLKKNKIAVGMVSIGNETNGGKMAGCQNWPQFYELTNAGSKAVREVYKNALVALHFTNPEKNGAMLDYAKRCAENIDFDVFGTSWYPWWHGTIENLSEVLDTIGKTYNKKVMVMETSYAFSYEDFDLGGKTSPNGGDVKPYPITIAGQANHINVLTDYIANKTTNGIGICYWEGAWIAVGHDYTLNLGKWEKYGSGWATSYAGIYDKDVAEFGPGGSQVDNQAFFDSDGKPLESLKMFNLVRYGNEVPLYIDGVLDPILTYYTYEDFALPETVEAVYNNNEHKAAPVTWEPFDVAAAKAAGNGRYEIHGTAEGGFAVTLTLNLMEYNYLDNYSFEDGAVIKTGQKDPAPWVITNNSATEFNSSYVVAVTNENPQTGSYNLNFWANGADVLNFNIEQAVDTEEMESGTYKFQISLMGAKGSVEADISKQNIYAYVKINGEIVGQTQGNVTVYNAWSNVLVTGITFTKGDTISVGVHVEGSEAGIWGSIDDCMLNMVL